MMMMQYIFLKMEMNTEVALRVIIAISLISMDILKEILLLLYQKKEFLLENSKII